MFNTKVIESVHLENLAEMLIPIWPFLSWFIRCPGLTFFVHCFIFFSLEARLTYLSYVSKVCNLGFSKNCKKKVMYSCNLSLKCINCSSQHHETHRFFLLWSDWNWTEKFWKNCKTNDDIMFEAALAAKVIIHTSRAVTVPNESYHFWAVLLHK